MGWMRRQQGTSTLRAMGKPSMSLLPLPMRGYFLMTKNQALKVSSSYY